MAWASEGEESRRDAGLVMLNALKVLLENIAQQDNLSVLGSRDQLAELLNEQVKAIRLEFLSNQRVLLATLPFNVV
jgi:hypothetical protein